MATHRVTPLSTVMSAKKVRSKAQSEEVASPFMDDGRRKRPSGMNSDAISWLPINPIMVKKERQNG